LLRDWSAINHKEYFYKSVTSTVDRSIHQPAGLTEPLSLNTGRMLMPRCHYLTL